MASLGPFSWVHPGALGRLLAVLTVLVVLSTVLLTWLGAVLFTDAAPSGIVSFELAGSGERAAAILASWDAHAQGMALLIQGFDFLYLLLYPAWFSLALVLLSHRLDGGWAKGGLVLAWLILLAAPLDVVENIALIVQQFHGGADLPAQVALWTAVPKFALIVLSSAWLVVGSTRWLVVGSR